MGNDSTKVSGRFDYGRRDNPLDKPKPFNPGPYAPEKTFADSRRDKFFGGDILRARLNSNFSGPNMPPPVPVIDPQKVEAAVTSIQENLTETWTDWDVSKGDLKGIETTFKDLNAAEANQVFGRLSDADVKKYADELSGIMGGYGETDKQQLFDDLAGKLDARNLARLGDALLAREDGKLIETSDVKLLSEAIAKNATDSVKAEYLQVITGRVEKDEEFALGAARILTSLKDNPQAFSQALGNLSDGQLKAVFKAATQETTSTSYQGAAVHLRYDTKPLTELVDAVSRTSDPALKARVFEAAALQMKEISEAGSTFPTVIAANKDAQAAAVRDALTGLLDSDTTGVVRALEENETSFNGKGITAYVKSMIESGDQAKLGTFINRLMTGNDLSGNAYARFGEQANGDNNEQFYQNAQVLGYFGGAIAASCKQITGDRAKQADIVKNIFGTVLGATGAMNPASGVASSVANGLTQKIVNDVVDGLNNETMEIDQAMTKLTIAHNPQTGRPYNGDAEESYKTNFNWVYNRN